MIIDHAILSNLSLDQQNCRVFECRTSLSNPQVQLTVYRQSKNGQKYMDIQYKTSTLYIDGINSIQFMVEYFFRMIFRDWSFRFFLVTSNRFFFS